MVATSIFSALAAVSGAMGGPLGEAQGQEILQAAVIAGFDLDIAQAIETAEDRTCVFVPSVGAANRMLVYDTETHRSVAVEVLPAAGMWFSVLDPGAASPSIEAQLGEDGYFGPAEALQALGVSDEALGTAQANLCRDACSNQFNWNGCGSCTAVSILMVLRNPPEVPAPTPTPVPTNPTPGPTAVATPTLSLELPTEQPGSPLPSSTPAATVSPPDDTATGNTPTPVPTGAPDAAASPVPATTPDPTPTGEPPVPDDATAAPESPTPPVGGNWPNPAAEPQVTPESNPSPSAGDE